MNIFAKAIVSNSEMIKNYKTCREKAEKFGKIFVLKNNKPDAVLLSIDEYEKLLNLIEHLKNLKEEDINNFMKPLTEEECTIDCMREASDDL